MLCNGKHNQQSEFLWSACIVVVQRTSEDDEQIPEVWCGDWGMTGWMYCGSCTSELPICSKPHLQTTSDTAYRYLKTNTVITHNWLISLAYFPKVTPHHAEHHKNLSNSGSHSQPAILMPFLTRYLNSKFFVGTIMTICCNMTKRSFTKQFTCTFIPVYREQTYIIQRFPGLGLSY